jgi:(p)ppGpp synthase/HD superfamily hydrolase
MHAWAQTNVQLFNQLRSEGYSEKERAFIRDAYEFAMRIFSGLYLPSGKPFIDHLVGTASVLVSVHAPVEVVAAGLIHAAHLHGDFGSVRQGISNKNRARLREVVGKEVDEYIARYDRLLLTPSDISLLQDTLDQLGSVDRRVALIRLANVLEHNLDFGGLYFAHTERKQRGHQRYLESRGPQLVELAERLGFPSLAAEMERTFRNVAAAELPMDPCIRCDNTIAYLIAPRSYRQCFSVMSWRKLAAAYGLSAILLGRAKRLCGRIWRSICNTAHARSRPA